MPSIEGSTTQKAHFTPSFSLYSLKTNQIAVDAAELDSFLAAAAAAHGDDWRVRLARAADWLGDAYSSASSRAPLELAASVSASGGGAALGLAQVSAGWERSSSAALSKEGFWGRGSGERKTAAGRKG